MRSGRKCGTGAGLVRDPARDPARARRVSIGDATTDWGRWRHGRTWTDGRMDRHTHGPITQAHAPSAMPRLAGGPSHRSAGPRWYGLACVIGNAADWGRYYGLGTLAAWTDVDGRTDGPTHPRTDHSSTCTIGNAPSRRGPITPKCRPSLVRSGMRHRQRSRQRAAAPADACSCRS